MKHYEIKLSFSTLFLDLLPVGRDLTAVIYGGDQPHVGCVVAAVPRPSLRNDGSISCTSSVINMTGHKDEEICRKIAVTLCKRKNAVTICTGGFHIDHISPAQIAEVEQAVQIFLEQLTYPD